METKYKSKFDEGNVVVSLVGQIEKEYNQKGVSFSDMIFSLGYVMDMVNNQNNMSDPDLSMLKNELYNLSKKYRSV